MHTNTKTQPSILRAFSKLALSMLLIAMLSGLQPPGVVRAETITFTIDSGDNGLSTITKTVGGVTMTLSNGTCNGVSRNFRTDNDGIFLRQTSGHAYSCVTAGNGVDAFDISFDSAVTLQSYRVDYVLTGASGTFDLTATSGNSLNNPLNPAEEYMFNSTPSLTASETASVAVSMTGGGPNQINTFRVSRASTSAQSISNGGSSATLQGVQITNNSTNTCVFTVTHNGIPPGGGSPDPGEMPVQWDITTDGNCGTLNVDLAFNYTDIELALGNNVTEGNLEVFKHASGTAWTNMVGTVNTGANTVSLSNVTSLSDWTIGDPTSSGNGDPAAITLQSLTARRGAVPTGLLGLLALGGLGVLAVWRRRERI